MVKAKDFKECGDIAKRSLQQKKGDAAMAYGHGFLIALSGEIEKQIGRRRTIQVHLMGDSGISSKPVNLIVHSRAPRLYVNMGRTKDGGVAFMVSRPDGSIGSKDKPVAVIPPKRETLAKRDRNRMYQVIVERMRPVLTA